MVVETLLLQIDPLVNFMFSLAQGWSWLFVLGAFMWATSYAEKMAHTSHHRNQQYLGLLLFVVAEAVVLPIS